jgi:hypothetical protein
VALIGVPAVGCRILSLIILSIATLASASDTTTLTCGNCNLAVINETFDKVEVVKTQVLA